MSASKLNSSSVFNPVSFQAAKNRLQLPANAVRVRKNGIEFRTNSPLPLWSEMTVDLQSPREAKKIHFTGVIVACTGNRHAGYAVSMLFTNLTRHSQERLNQLGVSRLS